MMKLVEPRRMCDVHEYNRGAVEKPTGGDGSELSVLYGRVRYTCAHSTLLFLRLRLRNSLRKRRR